MTKTISRMFHLIVRKAIGTFGTMEFNKKKWGSQGLGLHGQNSREKGDTGNESNQCIVSVLKFCSYKSKERSIKWMKLQWSLQWHAVWGFSDCQRSLVNTLKALNWTAMYYLGNTTCTSSLTKTITEHNVPC